MDEKHPRTAVKELGAVIDSALKDQKYGIAARAIARKIQLESLFDGESTSQFRLKNMQAEVEKAPAELKPVLQAILANWYWEYFEENRWDFEGRTQTSTPPGDDLDTWSLPQILDEVDRQFARVFESAEALKKIPISQFDDLFEKGTLPDHYRPTLYDVLAYNALAFYSKPEQTSSQYELQAESPIFAPVAEFLAWKNDDRSQSRISSAIALYQDLLRFHQNDTDKTAFYDADLTRLEFGNDLAVGDSKTEQYRTALKRAADAYADYEISSRFLFKLAEDFQKRADLVQAHAAAEQGLARFPDSLGGRGCYDLIQRIETPSFEVSTERVWNSRPLPTIDVTYKNLTKLYFRVVSLEFDVDTTVRLQRVYPENLDIEQRKVLRKRKPVLAWSVELPATDDYQLRTESIPAPTNLKPGWYYLIASRHQKFANTSQNIISYTDFWVSELAIVTRGEYGSGRLDGFVLNAETGEPITGAAVRAWDSEGQNLGLVFSTILTDSKGYFQFQTDHDRLYVRLYVKYRDQALVTLTPEYVMQYNRQTEVEKDVVFFTDRALYRPGQTIHFKGICIFSDQESDAYKVMPGRMLTVVFKDANRQEIERVRVSGNQYGSFSGSVTAPRDRLTGRMTLEVEEELDGSADVWVEEYKRPKFRVTLDPPAQPARLNGEVTLKGTALAYTGAPVESRLIHYRVTRLARYPAWRAWRCWGMAPATSDSQEIAHGAVAATRPDGSFDIVFTAKPDASVPESSEPTFAYQVTVDVTDSTGETRSVRQTINVGYTTLTATLTAESWQEVGKPVRIRVRTQTLDGENEPAAGTLRVYALKQPDCVKRAPLKEISRFLPSSATPAPDPTNPNSWENGGVVFEQPVEIDTTGAATISAELPAGIYRATFEAIDPYGKPLTAELPLKVLDPAAGKLPIKLTNFLAVENAVLEPGQELRAVWGSGYDQARALVEIEHRQKVVQSFWTAPGVTQQMITVPVNEAMRGGFTLRVTMVRENRLYTMNHAINVPWTNKNLTVRWEHFVSRLEPGQKETWTVVITGPNAQPAAAEFVAALYDASLDAFRSHSWPAGFDVFRSDRSRLTSSLANGIKPLSSLFHGVSLDTKEFTFSYRHFPDNFLIKSADELSRFLAPMNGNLRLQPHYMLEDLVCEMSLISDLPVNEPAPTLDLDQVSTRANLNETAFFYPHLISNKAGEVRIEFTMPEVLTEWKFLGFAHDPELRAGFLIDKVVTAKDLMVQPNPPRFVREGDAIEFTVKVTNLSEARQEGAVRLTFADLVSLEPVDDKLGNISPDQSFDIPSGESRGFSWKLSVPDGLNTLRYKAVASTGRLSDGEEGCLPVLPRRVLVRESLPIPLRGQGTKDFTFEHLLESDKSSSLRHQALTVQMVSNPSWYAVLALPYLMEYPYDCNEQTFSRLYANALARHIATSHPKIRLMFDAWKLAGGDAVLSTSPLERNQDLKSVLLEETPWVRHAQADSQSRRNVGILFDDNRLDDEIERLTAKLAEQQLSDGRWPWFPGGRANDFITLYIATGFGRLRRLGVSSVDITPALNALARLDAWMTEIYNKIPAAKRAKDQLSSLTALYLYGRSFFLEDRPVSDTHQTALAYWLDQARNYWHTLPRQNQGQLAVALKRFGDVETALEIVASLKECSILDDELGMYWKSNSRSWWWYEAPIETQAMMIEAFDEVAAEAEAVEDCKAWLLKQKQTQDWTTTKATADAVYALLLRGTNLLATHAPVEVSLGGQAIEPANVEAGTGFYEHRFTAPEIRPELGNIQATKADDGVAWGSVHWQYLEEFSKLPSFEATPLKLSKSLYTKINTAKGPTLMPVHGPVHVGDELVVRLVLKTDRDMEFLHLKDYRGSGTEPVNVLSGYRYQDGLGYYESTRDTATHFFIDDLPKGTYVFEYSVRVQLKGTYQTGFASIECMYAPEFNSHSESLGLVVE